MNAVCPITRAEDNYAARAESRDKAVTIAHANLRAEMLQAFRAPDARKVLVSTPGFGRPTVSLVEALNCLPTGDADAFMGELLAIVQDAAAGGNFRAARCLAQRASDHASYHADDAVTGEQP